MTTGPALRSAPALRKAKRALLHTAEDVDADVRRASLPVAMRVFLALYAERRGVLGRWPLIAPLLGGTPKSGGRRATADFLLRLADACDAADRRAGSDIFSIRFAEAELTGRGEAQYVAEAVARLAEIDLSTIEPEELGNLHERALAGEASTERRRLQGSYFTPLPVAHDILARTLDPLLTETNGANARAIRLVDPCCGAGLFLAAAFDRLVTASPERRGGGAYDRIEDVVAGLAAHQLFGVDVDPDAAHLARSVLTLKAHAILGPAARTLGLRWRIETGDALDGSRFDWSRCFPESATGFDLVVGNPPYLSHRALPAAYRSRLRAHMALSGGFDLSVLFIEAGLRMLRPGGVLGYLVSNKFLAADYGERLRRRLLEDFELREIVDVSSMPLFRGAATYPVVLVASRPSAAGARRHEVALSGTLPSCAAANRTPRALSLCPDPALVPVDLFRRLPGCIISPQLRSGSAGILARVLRAGDPLPVKVIRCGIARTGFARSLIDESRRSRLRPEVRHEWRPILMSGDVRPFRLSGARCRYVHESWLGADHRATIDARKVLVPGMGRRLSAAVDEGGHALGRVYYVTEDAVGESADYLAALLNSRLLNWCYTLLFWSVHLSGDYLRVNGSYLATLPIPRMADLRGARRETAARIASLSRSRSLAARAGESPGPAPGPAGELESLVLRLYGLDSTAGDISLDPSGALA